MYTKLSTFPQCQFCYKLKLDLKKIAISKLDVFKKKLVVKNKVLCHKTGATNLLSNKGQDWVHVLLSRLLSCLVSTLVIRERNVKEADLVV